MRTFFVTRFLNYNLLLSTFAVVVLAPFLAPTVAGLLQAVGVTLTTGGYGLSFALYSRQHNREFVFLLNFGVTRREIYGLACMVSGLIGAGLLALSALVPP